LRCRTNSKKPLGSGSFGEVSLYQGAEQNNNGFYAVKKIAKDKEKKSEQLNRFNREVQALMEFKDLDLPNLLHLHDKYEDKTYYYIITKYYIGLTLEDRLAKYIKEREVMREKLTEQDFNIVYRIAK
jgi:serine/threonine protein kinase